MILSNLHQTTCPLTWAQISTDHYRPGQAWAVFGHAGSGCGTCWRSWLLVLWDSCSCCSSSRRSCLWTLSCSCSVWLRACASIKACLHWADSTSTVLVTYCRRSEKQIKSLQLGEVHLVFGQRQRINIFGAFLTASALWLLWVFGIVYVKRICVVWSGNRGDYAQYTIHKETMEIMPDTMFDILGPICESSLNYNKCLVYLQYQSKVWYNKDYNFF